AIVSLLLGEQFPVRPALFLMSITAVLVLALVVMSPNENRSMTNALLYYTFIIYLAWFGPMWFARLAGYLWLSAYCVTMAAKWGDGIHTFLLTLVLTSVALGELVGIYKRRLENDSLTDALCGVWNKRGLAGVLEREQQAVRRTRQPFSVIYLDVDGLKRVNDVRGHDEGDRVLREFAAELDRLSRPQDAVARVGGDEFVLVLPGTGRQQAESIAARLREEVTACSSSFGVAQFTAGESTAECLARADRAMREEKQRKAHRPFGS
ncbi:MAG: GGDEF domain-containing protein, partial [Mycobacterium sp.]|nr:GGDEF domain-containing protein [Mycobacterium sp.]